MTSQQLDAFLAVARALNFTRAAEERFVSQPAISRQITALEHELGVTLFDRTGKKTRLTGAGQLLYEFYTLYRVKQAEVLEQARALNEARHEKVTLGILSGWSISHFLTPLLAYFAEEYPNVELVVESLNFRSLIAGVRNHTLGAMLAIDISEERFPDLEVRELTHINAALLFSSTHPAALHGNPRPEDFKDNIFWVPPHMYDERTSTADYVRETCAPYGFVPEIHPISNGDTMLEYIRNGRGVGIHDLWVRERGNSEFGCIRLEASHAVYLAWSKSVKSSVTQALVHGLQAIFSEAHGTNIGD